MQNFKKHIQQIKKGGTIIFLKKLKSLISLILQIPIYIISIPTVIIIRLIGPWFLIRLGALNSSRIGHFAKELELYLNDLDAGINISQKNTLIFFFYEET
jgi:hypothetical protein